MMKHRKVVAAVGVTAALATGGLIGATLGVPSISGAQDAPFTTTVPDAPAGAGHAGRHGRFGSGEHLDAAAKALGMTVEELRTAVKDGTSLADVAADKGIDKQKVIDALVKAGEARLDEAKAALPARVAEMVDKPLGGRMGGEGFGGRGGFGRGRNLDAAAKALGITVDDLRTAMEDGTSLADVAADKGVDVQKVIDALVADAKAKQAERVADGSITQEQADRRAEKLTERVTAMVNGKGFGGGFGHRGGPGHAPTPDDGAADSGD